MNIQFNTLPCKPVYTGVREGEEEEEMGRRGRSGLKWVEDDIEEGNDKSGERCFKSERRWWEDANSFTEKTEVVE